MATATQQTRDTALFTRRLFTVDEYYRMAEAGILDANERIELIEGEIVWMAPIGDAHVNVVDRLTELLVYAVERQARISVQNPVRLNDDSEPQPDLLVRRRESQGVSSPGDVLLAIEASDTTLSQDRYKARLYARAGIPELWIIDIRRRVVIRHREPSGDTYGAIDEVGPGQQLAITALPSAVIAVDDIFA